MQWRGGGRVYTSSFRGASKMRTRNLEIPQCAIAHLRSGPSDHPGMTLRGPPSVQHLDIIRRLRRRLDGDGFQRTSIGLGAAMRGAVGDDDEVAGLDLHFLVAEPDRSGAFQDVLDLVGVGMHVHPNANEIQY